MAVATSMDVTITFTGLFLFVPYQAHLYVLLPATGGMEHVACLSDGEKECDIRYNAAGDLLIPRLVGATGFQMPPESVFDLHRITRKPIPKRQLTGTPKDIFLRLKLPLASEQITGGKLSEWEIEGISPNPVLTHQVIWKRSGVPLGNLAVQRSNFASGAVEQSDEFVPHGRKLNLFFDHVPPEADCPYKGYAAHHFAHYFDAYVPSERPKIPKLAQEPDETCVSETKPLEKFNQRDRRAASTFTCMTAQASAQ